MYVIFIFHTVFLHYGVLLHKAIYSNGQGQDSAEPKASAGVEYLESVQFLDTEFLGGNVAC